MGKAVRLQDIARKAKVSTVTVSKALAGQKGVSEEKRSEIIAIAARMGYRKTVGTSGSRDGRSYTIGVIISERFIDEDQSFYWMLYQELSKYAITRNCFPMLEVISHDAEADLAIPRMLIEKKIEGIVIMGNFDYEFEMNLLKNLAIPCVYMDTVGSYDACDCVVSDNTRGGHTMTDYLFRMGHSKIGFVGTRLATQSIDDRYLGYVKSLMEHGVAVRDKYVIDDRDCGYGAVSAEKYFRLPDKDDMPTAFFCNCDTTASLLIAKLKESGLRVPDDVSVVGFDNYVNEKLSEVGITTYEINVKEMAKRTVHILMHKIDNNSYSSGVFAIAGKFIERNSVRRIGDPVPRI